MNYSGRGVAIWWGFLVVLTAGVCGCGTVARELYLPKDGVREAEFRVTTQRGVLTPMSDGVTLSSNVYRPTGKDAAPTILIRAPYSQRWKTKMMSDLIGEFWASRGYAVVLQSSRGRLPSGGVFYPLADDRADGIDTLRWLNAQPWCNGRIGMWGGSSFGCTQWAIADQDAPGPKAYMIQIASSDVHDALYPGGAFALESGLYWALRCYEDVDRIPKTAWIDWGANGLPLVEADDRAVTNIPSFDDWTMHTERDDYWKRMNGDDRAASIQAPVLLMGGWYDPFLPAQLNDYTTIQAKAAPEVARDTRLVIGPWSHAAKVSLPNARNDEDYRAAALAPSIDWFDTHLADSSDAARGTAPMRIFVMGINQWRDEQEWPLARATDVALFLNGGGNLSLTSSNSDAVADTFVYDPRDPVPTAGGAVLGKRADIFLQNDVENRRDVLVYTTGVLQEPAEVTGTVRVVLHVATSARNTDFAAKLVDVHPNGDAYNVCDGILRRGYAPGSPTEIEIELWPTSMVFKGGHRIRLEVSSSNFPRFDRNLNTGTFLPTETNAVTARQSVFCGASMPSRVVLPVVKGDGALGAGLVALE